MELGFYLRSIILGFLLCFGGLSAATAAEIISIPGKRGAVAVPAPPSRVVIMDYGMLDTLETFQAMGLLGNGVQVALPKSNLPDYLSKYRGEEFSDIGGLKDFNLEYINTFKPEVIIISGRQQDFYQELSSIAPVWQIDSLPAPYLQGTRQNIRDMGKLFAVGEAAEKALADIDRAAGEVRDRALAKGFKALVLLTNDGKISAYGSGSRFGIIHDALGFEQADPSTRVGIHGQLVNYEYIAKTNPDIIFVVDRSVAVIGKADGVRILENELVKGTTAAKKGRIVSLDPGVWYLSGGGLMSLRMMIDEVGRALEK